MPLSAMIMMGGSLESLLLSKFLSSADTDKSKLFLAKACPKDRPKHKPLNFKNLTIINYSDVAHELGWIPQTEKDLREVLKGYRNYLHPIKEKSHGVAPERKNAYKWEVTKSISR